MQAAQRQPSQQITDARMLSRMQQQRRPLLPTCTSLTGRPGKRCCAAASASASSLPTTQRSMCSLGAPGLPRASASSSAAARQGKFKSRPGGQNEKFDGGGPLIVEV